ncbi:MAG: putative selenate reductase subunit YgfK, partial [Candidatus Cloacimonetes bacterium]|nr:putative selenate reductase subunit YgfK [Candidatus Cloacimonadota bacterium]
IMDDLDIEKPCIEALDEGYNTEWSTELTVDQAYQEYVKAWILLHFLKHWLLLSVCESSGFIFNMSVGYDLKGIKSGKIDNFIESLKNASGNDFFQNCLAELKKFINENQFSGFDPLLADTIDSRISNSITLSTMHGCPPEDQLEICRYLLEEKKLHTYLKLNPTLLGYDFVRCTYDKLGFTDIQLKQESFRKDLQYGDAILMLKELMKIAAEQELEFGVKLSNTLPVINSKKILPGEEMYLSGRALYPLTINLAARLADEFGGKLPISYCGGLNIFNVESIYSSGIRPLTMASELLKPGGYLRFNQIAEKLTQHLSQEYSEVNVDKLHDLADLVLQDPRNRREGKFSTNMKIDSQLPLFDCYLAPCVEACPIHQNIPEYIRLIREKRYHEALSLIYDRNPLPNITGEICDHDCMLKCVRNDYENPVRIRDLKLLAARTGRQDFTPNALPSLKPDINVAIIGAGPAGISAAVFLRRKGISVTVFEKNPSPGGIVKYCIPNFRISSDAIEQDVEYARSLGVKFNFNCDPEFSLKNLRHDGFKYIIITIGAWISPKLDLESGSDRLINALDFLREFNSKKGKLHLGTTVAVIGGGNSAMDSARAALRVDGVDKVYLLYRRTIKQMPADREELNAALKDGIIFKELRQPISWQNGILHCQQMKLGEPDDSGRQKPLPTQETDDLKIDSVITAIGDRTDYALLNRNGIIIPQNKAAETDHPWRSNLPDVYLGGDALHGPASVVRAIADAGQISSDILEKEGIAGSQDYVQQLKFDQHDRYNQIISRKGKVIPASSEYPHLSETTTESERCLDCSFICNKCVEVCPNRANFPVRIESEHFRDQFQIIHIDSLCNECGNCETFCPWNGAPYQDKITLFNSKNEFKSGQNNGFYLDVDDGNSQVHFRLGNRTGESDLAEISGKYSDMEWVKFAGLIRAVITDYGFLLYGR